MSNTIIVPVDFSEQSIIALEQACNVAEVLDSTVVLLHITDEPSFVFSASAKAAQEEREIEIRTRLNQMCIDIQSKRRIDCSYELKEGKIYEQIAEFSKEKEARFVIMGTNGSVGIKKKFIGSNALRVVKESEIPVITIKGQNHNKGIKTIVLPLDLTKETKQKTAKAIELAQAFHSQICIVTVLESNDEYVINNLQRQVNQIQGILTSNGIENTADMIEKNGSISDSILSYAKEKNADLIMIMTQQEQNFTDLFIGSSAQELINNSEIPVCSIIPIKTEESLTAIFN